MWELVRLWALCPGLSFSLAILHVPPLILFTRGIFGPFQFRGYCNRGAISTCFGWWNTVVPPLSSNRTACTEAGSSNPLEDADSQLINGRTHVCIGDIITCSLWKIISTQSQNVKSVTKLYILSWNYSLFCYTLICKYPSTAQNFECLIYTDYLNEYKILPFPDCTKYVSLLITWFYFTSVFN